MQKVIAIVNPGTDAERRAVVHGRDAWALKELVMAGDKGCTPLDTPGPRWSHYVWKLKKAGVPVETIQERHGGEYAGTHARYRLAASVRIFNDSGATV